MKEINDRNKKVDVLKAIGIILVVLGHILQYCFKDYNELYLYKLIYCFHMPLFITISGYLSISNNKQEILIKKIGKKIKSLVIPYCVWSFFIQYIILREYKKNNFFEYFLEVIIRPDKGAWYLLIVFYLFLIIQLYIVIIKKYKITNMKREILIIFTITVIVNCIPVDKFGISLVKYYIIYYFIGYIYRKYNIVFNEKINKISLINLITLIIIELFLVSFWKQNTKINIGECFNNIIIIYIFDKIYRYLIAILLITIIIKCVFLIENYNYHLIKIGRTTLEIYLIHSYIIFIISRIINNLEFNIINYFFIIILTAITVNISLVINKRIKKYKIINRLLFGK